MSEMSKAVAMKFKLATRRLKLTQEQKRELIDWYADDHEDIEKIDQATFTLLLKQFCLSRNWITIHQFDEQI